MIAGDLPARRLVLAAAVVGLWLRVWNLDGKSLWLDEVYSVWRAGLGLIRFRGHIPKGGYDVHDGQNNEAPASAPAVD